MRLLNLLLLNYICLHTVIYLLVYNLWHSLRQDTQDGAGRLSDATGSSLFDRKGTQQPCLRYM